MTTKRDPNVKRMHCHEVKPGDVVFEYYTIMYVTENLNSWDGGCMLVGIDLIEGKMDNTFYAAYDHVDVLS